MPLRPNARACVNCGDTFTGSGDLCRDCLPVDIDTSTRVRTEPRPATMCPYCKTSIDWENVRRYSRNFGDGTVEVIYYCPECRSFLEVAAWMEQKMTRGSEELR